MRLDHRLQVGLTLDFPLLVRWANREEGTGRWAKKVRGKLKLIDAAEAQLKAMILLASTGGCRGASGQDESEAELRSVRKAIARGERAT